MRAVRLLQDEGQPFHVITVLTALALDEPERMFDFYVENGIAEVGFNIEEIEGVHPSSSLASHAVEARYRRFIRRFFELVWSAPGLLRLRELEAALGLILSDGPAQDDQNVPFATLSVAHDGTISTFSPELLGARHARFHGFGFGDVRTHRLTDVGRAPLFRAVAGEIRRGVRSCKRDCRYFRWCGGGAPANKLFETRRFDATETMHCRLTRQTVLDETLSLIEGRRAAPEKPHATIDEDARPIDCLELVR
jgi:uncharacterized protein